MLGKLEATASINTSWVELGLATCKKIAEALKGDIFLVDDEETDEQSCCCHILLEFPQKEFICSQEICYVKETDEGQSTGL